MAASFGTTPADCLAFKIYRDAMEVQRRPGWREAAQKIVARGLRVCKGLSPEARAMLESVLAEESAAAAGGAGGKVSAAMAAKAGDAEARERHAPMPSRTGAPPSQLHTQLSRLYICPKY